MRWQLALEEINCPVIITARISKLPQSDLLGVHFEFQLSKFVNKKQSMTICLSWYGKHPKLVVGDNWRLTVKLKLPHNLSNPGRFGYINDGYLFTEYALRVMLSIDYL